jgi:hypothetical protein
MLPFFRNVVLLGGLSGSWLAPPPTSALTPLVPPAPKSASFPRTGPSGALVATYCTPTYLEGCGSGSVGVTLADFQIETTSLNHRNSGCSGKGYGDFTSLSATLNPGQTYTFVANAFAQADQGNTGSYIKQRVSLWLDVNADGTFSPDERVYPKPGATGDLMNPTLRAQFTVPASAALGPTRLRVRTREETEEYDDPCWNYFYGETHDYTVNLGTATPPASSVCLDVKVLLEGPYVASTQTMRTSLNQRGLLPGQTPTGQFGVKTPVGQPYNQDPWSYSGSETVDRYDSTVVDWVLVSLRSNPDSLKATYRGVGLLRSNGQVTMVTTCPVLPTKSAYFVLVEHRNHLGVMTPAALPVTDGKLRFDFTTQQSFVRKDPPTAGQLQLGSTYLMYAADGLKTPSAQNFDINYGDSGLWKTESGLFDRYLRSDFNLDADVNFSDQGLWKKNSGTYSGIVH